MKKCVLASLLFLICFAVNAQIEQVYKPVILQLEDGNNVKEYVVGNFTHAVSLGYMDSTEVKNRVVGFSITMDSIDSFITNWIADPYMEKNGKILIKNKKTGETVSEFTFKGATINSFSEHFYNSSYSSYEQSNNVSMDFAIKKYFINGVEIKNIKERLY